MLESITHFCPAVNIVREGSACPSLRAQRLSDLPPGLWNRLVRGTQHLLYHLLLCLGIGLVAPPAGFSAGHPFKYDTTLYNKMQWREIGPFRAGRSIAVAGHKDQPLTYYFGATGGGVWKSEDGGVT